MTQQWSNATYQGKIAINAPAEKIFNVLANIESLPAYLPGLSDAQYKNNELQAKYSIQVLGVPAPLSFPVEIRLAESQKPTKLAYQLSSSIKGVLQWELQSQGNQTVVSTKADYQMNVVQAVEQASAGATTRETSGVAGSLAGNLMGGVAGGLGKMTGSVVETVSKILPIIITVNEGNFNSMLTNLKVICENLR